MKSFLAENVDLMVEISEKIKVASGVNDVEIVHDEVEVAEDADAEL